MGIFEEKQLLAEKNLVLKKIKKIEDKLGWNKDEYTDEEL